MRTYTIIMAAVVGALLTVAALGIANYYTCFAYKLPHKPALIEVRPQDTVVQVHPEWIVVPKGTPKSITGVLDAISTTTELDGRSWYCYWFVDGEGLYRDTLVDTLVIPVNRTQPPWEEGTVYQVEYTIEPDWWATIIAWEEVPK